MKKLRQELFTSQLGSGIPFLIPLLSTFLASCFWHLLRRGSWTCGHSTFKACCDCTAFAAFLAYSVIISCSLLLFKYHTFIIFYCWISLHVAQCGHGGNRPKLLDLAIGSNIEGLNESLSYCGVDHGSSTLGQGLQRGPVTRKIHMFNWHKNNIYNHLFFYPRCPVAFNTNFVWVSVLALLFY